MNGKYGEMMVHFIVSAVHIFVWKKLLFNQCQYETLGEMR